MGYDFSFDSCAHGQRLRYLTVEEKYTKERLTNDVADFYGSKRMIDVLRQLISVHGAPRYQRGARVPNSSAWRCSNVQNKHMKAIPSGLGKPGRAVPKNFSTRIIKDECLAV